MLLVITLQIESIPTYRIEESRISAQIYNFRNEFDMNSITYTRLREPIFPFEDISPSLPMNSPPSTGLFLFSF